MHCRPLLLPLLLLLPACSDPELVGIHVNLQRDGSGTVTTRALVATAAQSPAESKTQGITWSTRANLCCSQGTFRSLGEVKFGDGELRFVAATGDELPRLRVFVQRGPAAKWVQALVPDLEGRRAMAKVYDPSGKTKEIGDAIRIEIMVPGTVISSGVQPAGRGVDASHERNRAILVIPVATASEKGEELVFDLSWK